MRVTGGALRGRRLAAPPSGVRPTADRVRESLFAWLGDPSGTRVLDLYAGTGALGIEALSRGADEVVFVERSARALATLRRNLSQLQLEGRSRVLRGGALRRLRRLATGAGAAPFDLVLLDPPYDSDEVSRALEALVTSGLLAPHATVVVETATRHDWAPAAGLVLVDRRRYGETAVARLAPAPGSDAGPGPAARPGPASPSEPPGAPAARSTQGGATRRTMAPSKQPTLALFPASFDPITNGHLDLIERTRKVFDEVVVAVAHNVDKKGGTFSVDERIEMLGEVLDGVEGVRVDSFHGLLVDYARRIGATVVIRGLRAMSDFEYEFEMALMNKHLHPDIEIMFMMTSQENLYVSSSRLKELARFGTAIDEWVPRLVAKRLRERLGSGS